MNNDLYNPNNPETSNGVKITNAVYKVLDFFPEGDPLKYKAKEKALAILENVTLIFNAEGWMSLKNYLSPNREKAIEQLLNDIEVLENFLNLGKSQGWLSNVNFLIITKEYSKIKDGIERPKGVIKKHLETVSSIENPVVKSEHILQPDRGLGDGQILANRGAYSERQKRIMYILANREKAQVSDLVKELPNITKRTVRRDLDDLLKKGKIIRVGEWNQVFYKINHLVN